MSIKFPDWQVLVTRTDQIPKITREGDPTGAAGRMTPAVLVEYENRPRRVSESLKKERIRDKKERDSNNKGKSSQRMQTKGRNFDIRA
ncbi:MAG: hypothetical protein GX208_08140 [Firmicutes bacterium]|nr:hypothetical protein [Bacillota bacterium]